MTAATQSAPAGPGAPGRAGWTGPAAPAGATSSAGPAGQASRGPADRWRRWRAPIAISAIVVLAGFGIALLQPPPANGYLNPASTAALGTHALAGILAQRGLRVSATATPAAAAAQATSGSTLVITSPQYLTAGQLAELARVPASLVIVEPDRAALAALAPSVVLAGTPPVGPLAPGCRLRAAALAGPADMGGLGFRLRPGRRAVARCYPAGGLATLAVVSAAGRLTAVLGTGTPLTNEYLASQGNAALAINLLSSARRVIWLVPGPAAVTAAATPRSFTSLIPLPAKLVAIQLAIAVLLAALWRARRLGPLVSEQLPVVVRASETAEGHARLYRSRQARDRAAAALRSAALSRLGPAAELPRGATPDAITATLARRSALGESRVAELLYGPAPGSDAKLVSLAADLDALEEEVRAE